MKNTFQLDAIESQAKDYLGQQTERAPLLLARRMGLFQPKFDMNSPRYLMAGWLLANMSEQAMVAHDAYTETLAGLPVVPGSFSRQEFNDHAPKTKYRDVLEAWLCEGIDPGFTAQKKQQLYLLAQATISSRVRADKHRQRTLLDETVASLNSHTEKTYSARLIQMALLFRSNRYLDDHTYNLSTTEMAVMHMAMMENESARMYLDTLCGRLQEIANFVHAKNLSFNKIGDMMDEKPYFNKFSVQFLMGRHEAEFPDWRFIEDIYRVIQPMMGMRALDIRDYIEQKMDKAGSVRVSAYDMDLIDAFLAQDPNHTLNQAGDRYMPSVNKSTLYRTYDRWKKTSPLEFCN